ncbi:MAG: diacylglycerol kinase family lipid kinase, partial [Planctomycetota bacterium]|nr:diacylglycerol kinase family lipid kinase [Planctomycetota bacterium]
VLVRIVGDRIELQQRNAGFAGHGWRWTRCVAGRPITSRGRGRAAAIAAEAQALFRAAGWEAVIRAPNGRGDALHLAAAATGQCEVVVAVGGDGTVNEVVAGVWQQRARTPVAIIPAGTANVVARELGLPREVEALVRIAIGGANRLWDLGEAENADGEKRIFAMCAGAGLDAMIVAAVSRGRGKRGISLRHYYLPTVWALRRYPFPAMRVTVDGVLRESSATFAIVGNTRRYGGPFAFFADADPGDGLLDVCCLRSRSRARFAYCALVAACRKSLRGLADVGFYRGREIALAAEEEVLVQLDGDTGGCLPQIFRVLPSAVCFRAPPLPDEQRGRAPNR